MKNEDSRGFRKLYRGRNFVLRFQGILHWKKHLNRRRKHAKQHRSAQAHHMGR